jgi:ribosomal protein L11 methyltransferase
MNYIEIELKLSPRDPWTEILIADLANNGFESFVETEEGFKAYGSEGEIDFNDPLKGTLLIEPHDFKVGIETTVIPQKNWNAVWESDFKPVFVEDYCTILAPFHDPLQAKGRIVWIQPQMSFGTGHHQTTYLMTKSLFELEPMPEKVLDMGCGTGVLAIVAELLGAKKILAVDIEEWSAENTAENAVRNQCKGITAVCGDIDQVVDSNFGLILANINKNVLKLHLARYAELLVENGILMISGFFTTDAEELIELAKKNGLQPIAELDKEEWCCIHFRK